MVTGLGLAASACALHAEIYGFSLDKANVFS